jgi:cytochrome c
MSSPRQAVYARSRIGFRAFAPRQPVSLVVLTFICGIAADAAAADSGAAQSLAQKSGCFKCHGVDKKKDGPSLRDAAAKYKGNPDAQQKLVYHVTSGEKVKFDDGHEEDHKKVKTGDMNEIMNLVNWILSLEGGTKY